jgi:hypothetical protein
LLLNTISASIVYGLFEVGKPRDASNDMPNRRYLAWRLISPVATAKLFSLRTSNLPPSKEGGEGDCGRTNKLDAYQQKLVSSRRQPLSEPCLVPARPG